MKPEGLDREFIVIGENVHTTRILLRKGKLVTTNPDGVESVRFYDSNRKRRYLTIPAEALRSQDYEEGRVKHVKIAVQAAMGGGPESVTAMDYLRRLVERQVDARTDFLDLNVDEVSLKLEDQKTAMRWLVRTVQDMCSIPLSVDSSNIEIIAAGLEAAAGNGRRNMLNSASLERLEGPRSRPPLRHPGHRDGGGGSGHAAERRRARRQCHAHGGGRPRQGHRARRHLHRSAHLPHLGGRGERQLQLRGHAPPARQLRPRDPHQRRVQQRLPSAFPAAASSTTSS